MCKEVIARHKGDYQKINLYFEDESRFGLFTRTGKALTAKGVKPICTFQQVFQAMYLFGAFSPLDGDHFLFTMPQCNTATFQEYLNEFSKHQPDQFKVIVLDNGAFHKSKQLQIPKNMALIFLPPYSPELNPTEKIWWAFKRDFTHRIFSNLDELENYITQKARSLTKESVKKTCAFDYIFSSPFWNEI